MSHNPRKFQRPPIPLSQREKDKLADDFIEGAARATPEKKEKGKEHRAVLYLRCAKTLIHDLNRLERLTGIKPTTFCLNAIIEAVREKLKQIERDT